jgi:hypothetical protein
MSENSLLARWLEPEGGQIVGRQLEAKLKEMATSADPELQIKLDPEVLEAAQLVIQKAVALESLSEQEISMTQIDRGTDRNASGYYNTLLERERCFDHQATDLAQRSPHPLPRGDWFFTEPIPHSIGELRGHP